MKRIFLAFAAIALAGTATAQTPKLTTIKLAVLPYISNGIPKIALEEGYFREQGLDVQLVPFQSTPQFLPLLIKGDIDAGPTSVTPGFFNAILQGAPIKIVLPLSISTVAAETATAFVARRVDVESGKYLSAQAWKGARVVLAAGTYGGTGYMLAMHLKKLGLTLKDTSLPVLDMAIQPEALSKGQVDVVAAAEPILTRLLEKDDLALLFPGEPLTPNLAFSFITYGQRMLKDPELGARFAAAMLKATRQYRLGKTKRNVEILSALTGLDEATIRKIRWSDTDADGRLDPTTLIAYQNWLVSEGQLDAVVPASGFLDQSFIDGAKKYPGTLPEPRR